MMSSKLCVNQPDGSQLSEWDTLYLFHSRRIAKSCIGHRHHRTSCRYPQLRWGVTLLYCLAWSWSHVICIYTLYRYISIIIFMIILYGLIMQSSWVTSLQGFWAIAWRGKNQWQLTFDHFIWRTLRNTSSVDWDALLGAFGLYSTWRHF